jgi:hypothetical protein
LTNVPKSRGRRRKKRGGRRKNGEAGRKKWDPRGAGRPVPLPPAGIQILNFF